MHPNLLHPHRTTRSRRWFLLAVVTVSALAVAVGAAIGSPTKSHATTLNALIGSSGPPETFAINGAAKAFTKQTGIEVNVIVAADLRQQLAPGLRLRESARHLQSQQRHVATYAKAGGLAPLDKLKNVKSFYPSLRAAYTYKGHLYAAPKDFSTLALVINSASWQGAKLTAKDYPKTWAQLASVAKKLTRFGTGRPLHGCRVHRLGVFMIQNGGWLVSKDGRTATVNSKENIQAFNYVKQMINASARTSSPTSSVSAGAVKASGSSSAP